MASCYVDADAGSSGHAESSSSASSSRHQPTTADSTEMASRSNGADAGSSAHAESSSSASSSSRLGKVRPIFLSHSGKQKPFVERLYNALRKVNHDPFFDVHSLPKGSRFPPDIISAARECTLGVVVLSDDFLTSKWPMLELEILVQQRGKDAKLLPLFYMTVPEDLKCPMKLAMWQKKWVEELSQKPENIEKWGNVVHALRSFNGEIFERGSSETQYINRVVRSICKQVPCPLPYDVSEIQGHSRLAKEVVEQFELVFRAQQDREVCMVGLYGVGGAGKSTVCKVLVNFFWSKYLGKAHYLEFPTNSSNTEDSNSIVQNCKKMLEMIAGLDEKLLSKVVEIDQAVALMKAHLAQHDVFLAIDNVWENSREIAGRILKVGFSPESKIVVTSRSAEVLKELFRDRSNACVGPLPAPERDEAFQIFQETFAPGERNFLVRERHLLDGALERCKFHGSYHALALKLLGRYVKKACALGGLQDLSRMLIEIKNIDLPKGVEDVIRLSYDSLEERIKCMFLDIAVLPLTRRENFFEPEEYFHKLTVEKVCQWLRILYKGQLPKGDVATNLKATIYELILSGLLQHEINEDTGEKIIRVHDLLCDLAVKEVASSCRYFIVAGMCGHAVQEIEWQKLERVIVDESCEPQFIEQLQRQECQKLQVLEAREVGFLEGIDLRQMPALCVLKLDSVSLRSITNWPSSLAILDLQDVQESGLMVEVGGLSSSVQEVDMRRECRLWERVIDFCGLTCLMQLQFFKREWVERSSCARARLVRLELPDMSQLTCLEKLEIHGCEFLERIGDLSALTRLVSLILKRNKLMEEVGCLSASLRYVEINGCWVLKRLPDMSKSTRLEQLMILGCGSLEKIPDLSDLAGLQIVNLGRNESVKVVEGWSSSLRHIRIDIIGRALKRLPDMSKLTCLKSLHVKADDCEVWFWRRMAAWREYYWMRMRMEADLSSMSMEEVGGVSFSPEEMIEDCWTLGSPLDMSGLTRLENLSISGCVTARNLDLSGQTNLVSLDLYHNRLVEEVSGLSFSVSSIYIVGCNSLAKLPDLSGLTRLTTLFIQDCKSLNIIPDLSSLVGLDYLYLRLITSMEKMDGLSSNLRQLSIQSFQGCEALERLPDMSGLTRLENLEISCCEALERLPDMSGLTRLEKLEISRCEALERLPDMSGLTRLEQLEIRGCQALKSLPDMSGLTRLEKLEISGCEALERLPDMSGLTRLKELEISGCEALERLPDMSGLTCLEKLEIRGCQALERLPDMSGLTRLKNLKIRECESLKEMVDLSYNSNLSYVCFEWCGDLKIVARYQCVHSPTGPSFV